MTSKIFSVVLDFGASHPILVFLWDGVCREIVSKRDNWVLYDHNFVLPTPQGWYDGAR